MDDQTSTQGDDLQPPPIPHDTTDEMVEGDGGATDPVESDAVETREDDSVKNPRFVIKRAGKETDEILLFTPPAVIGRFDPGSGPVDVDFSGVEEGSYVSRKHCKVTEADGVYTITDLGSSNGTYLARNGDFERIDEAEIASGDEIALGNARVVFYD